MRISHKHKFVFIAPPKTASTTLRRTLDKYADVRSNAGPTSPLYSHVQPRKLEKYFEEQNWNWNEYFKFMFVRNPWARCVSKWEYRRLTSQKNSRFGQNSARLLKGVANFEEFVRKGKMGTPCYRWCFDASGNQLVDFIGKVENLQEDFNIVCDKIGIPRQKLPHKNKTKHKHYTEYYDEEIKQIVAEKYAKDIEYFGYEFGE
jgi:hypothetical protein